MHLSIFSLFPRFYSLNLYVLENISEVNCKLHGIVVKEIDYNNVADVLSFKPEREVRKFKRYLENINYKGFYGYYNDEVIAHIWVCYNISLNKYIFKNYFTVNPQNALIFNIHVSSKYRGNKIQQHLMYCMSMYFKNIISDKLYIDTEKSNIVSNKAINKVGATFLQEILLLKIKSRTILRIK